MKKITLINRKDPSLNAYILVFDAYASTRLLVYARHLEAALDECVDWIAEHEPGLLCDDAVADEYKRAIAEGCSDEEAFEEATIDTTCAGDAGHYLPSWEWGIALECATPRQIRDYVRE